MNFLRRLYQQRKFDRAMVQMCRVGKYLLIHRIDDVPANLLVLNVVGDMLKYRNGL